MSKTTKKVLFFIVEGQSESSALNPILKKFFSNGDVHFHIYRGDITADWDNNIANIEAKILECLNIEFSKYKFLPSDIEQIIHLVDMDGAFVPDQNIKENKNLKDSFVYSLDDISGKNRQKILDRNHRKQKIINHLCVLETLSMDGKSALPYAVYYFSRNMDHTLYNEIKELTNSEKEYLSDEFADKYEDDTDGFISFISDREIAVEGEYDDTWKFIMLGTNSLHRHSNFHLVFKK